MNSNYLISISYLFNNIYRRNIKKNAEIVHSFLLLRQRTWCRVLS